jgi:hypothetical protein
MNIWIRIFSNVETDGMNTEGSFLRVNAVTCLAIYSSEQFARTARENRGGLVLEVSASSLRGQFEPGYEILLIDEAEAENDAAPRTTYASVVYPGIAHGAGNRDDAVSPERVPWLRELERELGVRLYE